jgi:cysteine desulfurase
MKNDNVKISQFHQKFLNKVKEIDHVYINGDLNNKVPNILNVSFNFVEGESLIMGLKDIAVSSGSACTSASLEPSYVLRALGRKDELAHSSIRFSFGRFTSDDDVSNTLDILENVVHRLRELSPLWEMHLDGIDLDTVEWKMH